MKQIDLLIDKPKREKPKNIAAVTESVREAPPTSINSRFQQLIISETSLRRILHKNLGVKPNWFRSWSQLTIQYVFPSLSGLAIDLQKVPILTKKIIFSDEAHFDLGGCVNKQIWCFWGTENLHAYIEKLTHTKRVTVWCGFWSRGVIGPFFFWNEQGVAVTVKGDYYRAILNKILFTRIAIVSTGWHHLSAAIWHRWTIICVVSSKISHTPTSQIQLTL